MWGFPAALSCSVSFQTASCHVSLLRQCCSIESSKSGRRSSHCNALDVYPSANRTRCSQVVALCGGVCGVAGDCHPSNRPLTSPGLALELPCCEPCPRTSLTEPSWKLALWLLGDVHMARWTILDARESRRSRKTQCRSYRHTNNPFQLYSLMMMFLFSLRAYSAECHCFTLIHLNQKLCIKSLESKACVSLAFAAFAFIPGRYSVLFSVFVCRIQQIPRPPNSRRVEHTTRQSNCRRCARCP